MGASLLAVARSPWAPAVAKSIYIYYGLITVHHFHWQLISCLRCEWYHNRCFIQDIDNFGKKM